MVRGRSFISEMLSEKRWHSIESVNKKTMQKQKQPDTVQCLGLVTAVRDIILRSEEVKERELPEYRKDRVA